MTTIPFPTPVPMHMGALHPVEQWLTLLLAFGPFVVLGVVVWLRRREHVEADVDSASRESPSSTARDA